MLDILTLLVFLTVFVIVLAVAGLRSSDARNAAVEKRLQDLMREVTGEVDDAQSADMSVLLQKDEASGPFAAVKLFALRVKKDCDVFGWSKNLALRIGLIALISFVLAAFIGRMTEYPMAVSVVGGIVFSVVIAGALYWRAKQLWLDDLAAVLPEAIDSIARICRAGVPAQTAFGLAAQNLRGALSDELKAVDQWLKLGVPLKQVLQDSAARVPVAEYRFFAVIVIISQESGGRLADTLERLAATLRDRAELALKVQAKTSEARASIKIVACLVPGVLIYQYIQAPGDFHFLVTDPVGIRVLIYAAVSVAFGLFITWLMVRRIR